MNNIIEQHIKEAEEVIASNDSTRAEDLYNKLLGIYRTQI